MRSQDYHNQRNYPKRCSVTKYGSFLCLSTLCIMELSCPAWTLKKNGLAKIYNWFTLLSVKWLKNAINSHQIWASLWGWNLADLARHFVRIGGRELNCKLTSPSLFDRRTLVMKPTRNYVSKLSECYFKSKVHISKILFLFSGAKYRVGEGYTFKRRRNRMFGSLVWSLRPTSWRLQVSLGPDL